MISIYILCDPVSDEIRYVGLSRSPRQRLRAYCCENGGHTPHLRNWLESIGRKPRLRVLETVDESIADECERQWIAYFKLIGIRLINYTCGGEKGFSVTDTHKERLRRLQRNRVETGTHNFLKPEVRAKIVARAKASIGIPKPWSRNQALKLSAAQKGSKLTEEHKRKCSLALTGKVRSPEAREKDRLRGLRQMAEDPVFAARMKTLGCHNNHAKALSASLAKRRGVPLTAEHRAKISAAMKGKRNSGLVAYWEALK